MDHLIFLDNVYKIYGEGLGSEVRALNGVDLSIDRGEFVAIVGTSGSGKTTMMNILGCLDIPTYGDYVLNGELVSELEDTELSRIRNREIGFIFQGFNLIPELTAIENVELPILYSGIKGSRRELAMDALRRVGLEDRAKHRPSEMSGGQQQRVAIARALTTKPPIILADEPTGNLDSKNGEQVMEILRELHSEGSTVVLITHDGTIARMADRIIRLLDGKIVFDSKFDEGDPFSEEVLHVSASGI
ncbi:MAG: ABC transporter ATP-binding protein [Clostridiales bacterium]|jgi:putative ABC transport system ATP-binding protein|nr:ABC transporter ATP-binding protein [Clostridiales bacterium]